MTTIVNTPAPVQQSDDAAGMFIGLAVLAVFLFVFFVYGLPAIRHIGSPQINIPGKIDINVSHQTK